MLTGTGTNQASSSLHTHSTAPNTGLPLLQKPPAHQQAQRHDQPLSCPAHVLVTACLRFCSFPALLLICCAWRELTPQITFSRLLCPLVSCWIQCGHWWGSGRQEEGKGQTISYPLSLVKTMFLWLSSCRGSRGFLQLLIFELPHVPIFGSSNTPVSGLSS